MKIGFITVVLALLLGAAAAAAQDQPLDPNATPDHGIAAGGVGFQPDPFRVERITGGGAIDAASLGLGADCVGEVNAQPAFRFQALTAFDALRFIFISDAVTWDASLIVRDPAGSFHCNNDSYGLNNPTVEIDEAAPGDYDVWVGALSDEVVGDLFLTTRRDITPGSTALNIPLLTATPSPTPTATPIPPTALNPTLTPLYGSERLAAGFLPDPYFRALSGGGALSVEASVSGDDCAGYASGAPDFHVQWSGTSTRLRFLFDPLDSGQDPALIVQAPDGSWSCNRDFAPGYDEPQVDLVNPAEGAYSVWVSDEAAANESIAGVLYVTEKQYSPETVPAAGTPPSDPAGLDGLTPGTSAFAFDASAPDPTIVIGALGGGDVQMQSKDCPGWYSALPTFAFMLPQPTAYLRVFFVADNDQGQTQDDPTLIVRMPDGTWYCDDDSFRSKQPTVDVIGSGATGAVSVWVGSFDGEAAIPGRLYLTRGAANPLDPTRPPPG